MRALAQVDERSVLVDGGRASLGQLGGDEGLGLKGSVVSISGQRSVVRVRVRVSG